MVQLRHFTQFYSTKDSSISDTVKIYASPHGNMQRNERSVSFQRRGLPFYILMTGLPLIIEWLPGCTSVIISWKTRNSYKTNHYLLLTFTGISPIQSAQIEY